MKRLITRRRFLQVGGTAVASTALAACGVPVAKKVTKSGLPKRGGILVIAQDAAPLGLDPQKDAAFSTLNIIEQMYTTLLRWNDTESTVEPDLATHWEQPDSTTFTFHLRQDVKFQNGRPLTSADVQYTFQRIMDPATGCPWGANFSAAIDTMSTPDNYTITFNLKKPFAPFIPYLATVWYCGIVYKEEVDANGGSLTKGGYGTGPFMLEQYVPGVSIKLKRNPYYYEKGLPYLDGLLFNIMPDDSTRMAAIRDNTAQMTWFAAPRSASQLEGVAGVHVEQRKYYAFREGLELDQTKAPFNDVRVRQALSLSLNRSEIASLVMLGNATVGTCIPPAAAPYGDSAQLAASLPNYQENLTQARSLLSQAGYPNGFNTLLEVSPAYYQDVPTGEIIQQQAARAGIKIQLKQAEWGKELTDYLKTANPMTMIGLVWQPDPDGYIFNIFYSKSPINLGKWSDPEVDSLMQQGRSTYDVATRLSIYQRIQQIVADKAYFIIPYVRTGQREVWRDSVHGYIPTPGNHRVYLRQTWID